MKSFSVIEAYGGADVTPQILNLGTAHPGRFTSKGRVTGVQSFGLETGWILAF